MVPEASLHIYIYTHMYIYIYISLSLSLSLALSLSLSLYPERVFCLGLQGLGRRLIWGFRGLGLVGFKAQGLGVQLGARTQG